jgi:low temperature requirement protein LtrA
METASRARVTLIELFFDLVFVFALTQVTALMADDLSGRGILRGVLILGLLWWSWVGYAWLCNVVKADEGAVRSALLIAMIAMFVLALAIPGRPLTTSKVASPVRSWWRSAISSSG